MVEVFCQECWQRCLTVWKASGREEEGKKGRKHTGRGKKTQQLLPVVPGATVNALHPLTHLLTASRRWYHAPSAPERQCEVAHRVQWPALAWWPLSHQFLLLFSRWTLSDSLQPHALQPARLLSPWDSPGRNTRVGCHFLLQGNLPDSRIESVSPAWQADSLPLSHQGSPATTFTSPERTREKVISSQRCTGPWAGMRGLA